VRHQGDTLSQNPVQGALPCWKNVVTPWRFPWRGNNWRSFPRVWEGNYIHRGDPTRVIPKAQSSRWKDPLVEAFFLSKEEPRCLGFPGKKGPTKKAPGWKANQKFCDPGGTNGSLPGRVNGFLPHHPRKGPLSLPFGMSLKFCGGKTNWFPLKNEPAEIWFSGNRVSGPLEKKG